MFYNSPIQIKPSSISVTASYILQLLEPYNTRHPSSRLIRIQTPKSLTHQRSRRYIKWLTNESRDQEDARLASFPMPARLHYQSLKTLENLQTILLRSSASNLGFQSS